MFWSSDLVIPSFNTCSENFCQFQLLLQTLWRIGSQLPFWLLDFEFWGCEKYWIQCCELLELYECIYGFVCLSPGILLCVNKSNKIQLIFIVNNFIVHVLLITDFFSYATLWPMIPLPSFFFSISHWWAEDHWGTISKSPSNIALCTFFSAAAITSLCSPLKLQQQLFFSFAFMQWRRRCICVSFLCKGKKHQQFLIYLFSLMYAPLLWKWRSVSFTCPHSKAPIRLF